MKTFSDQTIESYNRHFRKYEERTSLEISPDLKKLEIDDIMTYVVKK